VALFIVVCTGATLFVHHIQINEAKDASHASSVSHKLINNGTIRLSSPGTPVQDHDGFIPQYRFCHRRLSSHKARLIQKQLGGKISGIHPKIPLIQANMYGQGLPLP
jgi:hypothetical protein